MFLSAGLGAKGDFFTDGAYDANVIIHEYTHGVSERLARQVYTTFQGASMGEGWSDFLGLEYIVPEGAPPDGIFGSGNTSARTGDPRQAARGPIRRTLTSTR